METARNEKDKYTMQVNATLAQVTAELTVAYLSGKRIGVRELMPSLFDDKSGIIQDRDWHAEKRLILRRLGIDKRGGSDNGG